MRENRTFCDASTFLHFSGLDSYFRSRNRFLKLPTELCSEVYITPKIYEEIILRLRDELRVSRDQRKAAELRYRMEALRAYVVIWPFQCKFCNYGRRRITLDKGLSEGCSNLLKEFAESIKTQPRETASLDYGEAEIAAFVSLGFGNCKSIICDDMKALKAFEILNLDFKWYGIFEILEEAWQTGKITGDLYNRSVRYLRMMGKGIII